MGFALKRPTVAAALATVMFLATASTAEADAYSPTYPARRPSAQVAQPLATPLDGPDEDDVGSTRFSTYVELGGAGLIGSGNIDLVLGDALALRLGYGLTALVGMDIVLVPLTVSYLGNHSSVHRYELGAGGMVVWEGGDTFPVLTALIGYRYQPRRGFMFRVGAHGFWNEGDGFLPFPLPYISFGSTL